MVDPRTSIIDERMKHVRNLIAVSGGKGGVGKSLVASTLALILARKGCKVGLFDLDFTSPSTHIILGIKGVHPKEEKGIIPPKVHNLQYMSIIYYSGDLAAPLRGTDISNALIELLSITRWAKLDYLILDMPPGISDATLDLIRLVKRLKFLIVTTPSQLAFETMKKLASLLATLKIPVIGIVDNIVMSQSQFVQQQAKRLGLNLLGQIPYDPEVEDAIGNPDKLLKTVFAKRVEQVVNEIQTERHCP
jgi:ATP-binding protein involved in chromosome partitioning